MKKDSVSRGREKKLAGMTIAQRLVREDEGSWVAERFFWTTEYQLKGMWIIQKLLKAKI